MLAGAAVVLLKFIANSFSFFFLFFFFELFYFFTCHNKLLLELCFANQLTGFYMRATLAFNGLIYPIKTDRFYNLKYFSLLYSVLNK